MICFYANYKNCSFPTQTSQKYLLKLGKLLSLKLKKTSRKHRNIPLEIRAEKEHFPFSRWDFLTDVARRRGLQDYTRDPCASVSLWNTLDLALFLGSFQRGSCPAPVSMTESHGTLGCKSYLFLFALKSQRFGVSYLLESLPTPIFSLNGSVNFKREWITTP